MSLSANSRSFTPSFDKKGNTGNSSHVFKPAVNEFVPNSSSNAKLKPTVKEFVPSTSSTTFKPTVKEFIPSWEMKGNLGNSNEPLHSMNLIDDQDHTELDITSYVYEEEQDFPYVNAFRKTMPSLYVQPDIRDHIAFENSLLTYRLQPSDPAYISLPITIHNESFHSITPLPSDGREIDANFPTITYKATRSSDSVCYVIRRTLQCAITTDAAKNAIRPWLEMQRRASHGLPDGCHPCIVGLRDVFQTTEFTDNGGGQALCFVYDYIPAAVTLETKYFLSDHIPLAETLLWSYLCQFMTALSAIHSSGLACKGVMHPSKILVTPQHRIKLNCCGLVDALGIPVIKPLEKLILEDIVAVGKLMISLACQTLKAVSNLPRSMSLVRKNYSSEFTRVLTFLLSKHDRVISCMDVLQLMGHKMLLELTNVYTNIESLKIELSKEVQNGRLFRLVVTLGYINERPEFKQNTSWAETETRYLLKLFRDYVFHQVDNEGNPNLDMGHVIDSLNQLDAGTQEKILLMSRDQENMIITTFGEMKKNMVDALQELRGKSTMEILAARSHIDVDMNLGSMQPMHR